MIRDLDGISGICHSAFISSRSSVARAPALQAGGRWFESSPED